MQCYTLKTKRCFSAADPEIKRERGYPENINKIPKPYPYFYDSPLT
jgi:hypothetical protein